MSQQNLVISNMTDGMVTIALALLSNPPLQPSTPSCPVPDKSFPHNQEESVNPSSSAATYQSATSSECSSFFDTEIISEHSLLFEIVII